MKIKQVLNSVNTPHTRRLLKGFYHKKGPGSPSIPWQCSKPSSSNTSSEYQATEGWPYASNTTDEQPEHVDSRSKPLRLETSLTRLKDVKPELFIITAQEQMGKLVVQLAGEYIKWLIT